MAAVFPVRLSKVWAARGDCTLCRESNVRNNKKALLGCTFWKMKFWERSSLCFIDMYIKRYTITYKHVYSVPNTIQSSAESLQRYCKIIRKQVIYIKKPMFSEHRKTLCTKCSNFLADHKNLMASAFTGTSQDAWQRTGDRMLCLLAFPIHFLIRLRRQTCEERTDISCFYFTPSQVTQSSIHLQLENGFFIFMEIAIIEAKVSSIPLLSVVFW